MQEVQETLLGCSLESQGDERPKDCGEHQEKDNSCLGPGGRNHNRRRGSNGDRRRALRFASMYMGEDAEAFNWDADRLMIRSPITGSRGPRFEMTAEDWETHRPVLADDLSPFEDVPGTGADRNPMAVADGNDDTIFSEVLQRMNRRMARGDVPLNLTASSLITHAFLYTGEDKYRQWVLDYLDAWRRRTEANRGITPDNIGPSGLIGECMDGMWWGGYYGWRWPHGAVSILEPLLIAGANAQLLSGQESHLDLYAGQLDGLWERGRTDQGDFKIPHRHGDTGWFDYREPESSGFIHLNFLRGSEADRARLARCLAPRPSPRLGQFGEGGQYSPQACLAELRRRDQSRGYHPERLMRCTLDEVERRLEVMANDNGNPNEWDVHHWQDINPVLTDPLLQLTSGSPGVIYHGGLCHARIRHFDPEARRPRLPDRVAALVSRIRPESVDLEFVNLHGSQTRNVMVQAGAFGEHLFTQVLRIDDGNEVPVENLRKSKTLEAQLQPASSLRLRLHMLRFSSKPSYAFPWS